MPPKKQAPAKTPAAPVIKKIAPKKAVAKKSEPVVEVQADNIPDEIEAPQVA